MLTNQLLIAAKEFIINKNFKNHIQDLLIIYSNEDDAFNGAEKLKFLGFESVLYLPNFDNTPYDQISSSPNILAKRAKILTQIAAIKDRKVVTCTASNLLNRLPPIKFLVNSSRKIKINDQLNITNLTKFLVENGYNRSSSCYGTGDFAVRGEIIDLVTIDNLALRINFNFDKIESIKIFNLDTQVSIDNIEAIELFQNKEIIINQTTIINFKNYFLQNFGVNATKHQFYESIVNKIPYPGYEQFISLFYPETISLLSYFDNVLIITDELSTLAMKEYENTYRECYQLKLEANQSKLYDSIPILPVEKILFKYKEILESDLFRNHINLSNSKPNIQILENINIASINEKKTLLEKFEDVIKENLNKIILVFCKSQSGFERLKSHLSNKNYLINKILKLSNAIKTKSAGDKQIIINFVDLYLSSSLIGEKYLFIAEQDIIGEKSAYNPSSSKRKLKDMLLELDNITQGDYVVHQNHGIGQFISLETITVEKQLHDCLKIIYAKGDKLYLPVENISLIKKYGDDEGELDYLGSSSWQRRKSKLKNRITELAQKLLQIAAKRKSQTSEIIQYDSELYQKFCDDFRFTETQDQLNTIEDIRNDLSSGILMDRLVCGDVGFGKTEIAMRAAFMVLKDIHSNNSQVVIIVPTTLLAKQHYENFSIRFQKFGINVVHLSRLISKKIADSLKLEIANGKAQLIIGTHALFASNIKFNNLRLIIIDEEQRFGVEQKENLKALAHTELSEARQYDKSKTSHSHILSLSATPIPRTLQMSLLGIKDLSLIATPPFERMPIRTTVAMFDPVIIRDALMREYYRGGKSFYICPKIKDIPDIETRLKFLVPELKFKILHGQMPATKVDQVMNEFYEGNFDILVSTTIIESGIDIPSANTVIIHNANNLGLSQLYQLRGRVGRAKIRGYAYLVLSQKKLSTKHAIQRLEIMQNADSLGIGFSIASHDMDSRGFGNLVGQEQSGNIREVGIELYQEMLEEAMLAHQSTEKLENKSNININLPVSVFISSNYIADDALRLAIYRRAGNLQSESELKIFADEMVDRFGPIPNEFQNLLDIIVIKIMCYKLHIISLDSGPLGFLIKFNTDPKVADLVMKFSQKNLKNCKIKPDNKIAYLINLKDTNIILAANNLLRQLIEYS